MSVGIVVHKKFIQRIDNHQSCPLCHHSQSPTVTGCRTGGWLAGWMAGSPRQLLPDWWGHGKGHRNVFQAVAKARLIKALKWSSVGLADERGFAIVFPVSFCVFVLLSVLCWRTLISSIVIPSTILSMDNKTIPASQGATQLIAEGVNKNEKKGD